MPNIYSHIARARAPIPITRDGEVLYTRPTPIARPIWNELGDNCSALERLNVNAPHDKVITLRLDITGMSTVKKYLKARGAFTDGWNYTFAQIMQMTARSLADKYNARWVYTQSDEITIVIVPSDNPKYEHPRAGKVQKLISLAAAHASAYATLEMNRLVRPWWPVRIWNAIRGHDAPPISIEFDCRMAVWDNERDAFQLILWRAYDCGVNGVTDACHNQKDKLHGITHRKLLELPTAEKLEWLAREGLLPLPAHQECGTLFRRVAREITAINRKTQLPVTVVRNVLEWFPGPVVNRVQDGLI